MNPVEMSRVTQPPEAHIAYKWLARQPYLPIWRGLQQRAEAVALQAADEIIWCCEHDPVYTTGRRGVDNRAGETLPAPLLEVDRGGETTFHGPGQIMLYPVVHLARRAITIRRYASMLEQSCIDLLAKYDVSGIRREGFPGVWVGEHKIAAIGLRVRQGVVFHGMALNVDVALAFMAAIHPCGLHFSVTNLSNYVTEPGGGENIANLWVATLKGLLME